MTAADRFAAHADEVRRYARGIGWFLPGAELADLEQEALLGLWLACCDYQPELGPFGSFARMCARRRMVTALKAAQRFKHQPLTEAAREAVGPEGGPMPVLELLADPQADLAAQLLQREALRTLLRACDDLTQVERRAFFGIAQGRPYRELGSSKRIDNANQRAKRKLRRAMAA